jgi:hypothetical protein
MSLSVAVDRRRRPRSRIELRFADGLVLHDDCAENAALFITDQTVTTPGTVILLDPQDNEIARHLAFPEH